MHGKTLRDWRAKRAGGRITVYGTDVETGQETKIPGVDVITPRREAGKPTLFGRATIAAAWADAVDMHGNTHKLLIA